LQRLGGGGINIDSLDVGMSDNDDDDDVHFHHPAGPSFWVQMLKSSISTLLSSDPLDMSMVQRNFVSHYYSTSGGGGIIISGS
jgi:hypothetical protein